MTDGTTVGLSEVDEVGCPLCGYTTAPVTGNPQDWGVCPRGCPESGWYDGLLMDRAKDHGVSPHQYLVGVFCVRYVDGRVRLVRIDGDVWERTAEFRDAFEASGDSSTTTHTTTAGPHHDCRPTPRLQDHDRGHTYSD